jgi:hypothetical protein
MSATRPGRDAAIQRMLLNRPPLLRLLACDSPPHGSSSGSPSGNRSSPFSSPSTRGTDRKPIRREVHGEVQVHWAAVEGIGQSASCARVLPVPGASPSSASFIAREISSANPRCELDARPAGKNDRVVADRAVTRSVAACRTGVGRRPDPTSGEADSRGAIRRILSGRQSGRNRRRAALSAAPSSATIASPRPGNKSTSRTIAERCVELAERTRPSRRLREARTAAGAGGSRRAGRSRCRPSEFAARAGRRHYRPLAQPVAARRAPGGSRRVPAWRTSGRSAGRWGHSERRPARRMSGRFRALLLRCGEPLPAEVIVRTLLPLSLRTERTPAGSPTTRLGAVRRDALSASRTRSSGCTRSRSSWMRSSGRGQAVAGSASPAVGLGPTAAGSARRPRLRPPASTSRADRHHQHRGPGGRSTCAAGGCFRSSPCRARPGRALRRRDLLHDRAQGFGITAKTQPTFPSWQAASTTARAPARPRHAKPPATQAPTDPSPAASEGGRRRQARPQRVHEAKRPGSLRDAPGETPDGCGARGHAR